MQVKLKTARAVQAEKSIIVQDPNDIITVRADVGQRLIDEGAAEAIAAQKPERRTAK